MATHDEARAILSELLTDPRIRAHLCQVRPHVCKGGWRVRAVNTALGRAVWINSEDELQGVLGMWAACGCWDGQMVEAE